MGFDFSKKQNQPLLLGLTTSLHWIDKVADNLNLPWYKLTKKVFADQEIFIEIPISVRNRDVFLCQSTSRPANDNLMEIMIAIDALKRASVNSISLVMPYFGYARQDRKAQGREPITAKLIANLLSSFGIKRIITFDLHSPQIQGFFDIPIDHLTVLPQLIIKLLENNITNYVLIAPDHGGYQRIKKIGEYLHNNIAIMSKKRPKPNETSVNFVHGNVKNKNVIFIDDIIDTANTIVNSLQFLKKQKIKSAYVVATHAVFSCDALKKLHSLYQEGWLKKVLVTNSIVVPNADQYPFLEFYNLDQDISNIIFAICHGHSVSEYGKKQFEKLRSKKQND